jgi:maltose O-acetyltransferase
VQLLAATHPLDSAERAAGLEYALPITIDDDPWIGGGVIVGPGVTVGARSVIGAGSVVVRDVPADVVAVGNPCRIVRELR